VLENTKVFGDAEQTIRGTTTKIRAEVNTPVQGQRAGGGYLNQNYYDPAELDIIDYNVQAGLPRVHPVDSGRGGFSSRSSRSSRAGRSAGARGPRKPAAAGLRCAKPAGRAHRWPRRRRPGTTSRSRASSRTPAEAVAHAVRPGDAAADPR